MTQRIYEENNHTCEPKPRQIQVALDELEKSLIMLADRVLTLESRLAPILVKNPQPAPEEHESDEMQCPLAIALHKLDEIARTAGRRADIILGDLQL